MITKERLEELIKERATVWESKYGKVKEFDLSTIGDFLISKEYIKVHFYQPHNFITRKRFSRLFENKEDAEFSKYQNIPRIERLSLPTWEEVKNERVYEQYFCNSIGNNFYFDIANYGTYPTISVTCVNDFRNKYKPFEKKFTKTNFYKACELCRKLFLGEVE